MAIRIVNSLSEQVGTLGKYQTIAIQIYSDTDLTSQRIEFIPTLFSSDIQNLNAVWSGAFPSTSLNFVGSPTNENGIVTIEQLDANNFVLRYEFLWTRDIDGALSDKTINNYEAMSGGGVSDFMAFYISVGGNSILSSIPVSGTAINTHPFSLNYSKNDSDDAVVFIRIDGENIYNNFYVGVGDNNIANNVPYAEDVELQYGLVSDNVYAHEFIDLTTSSITPFVSGTGFLQKDGYAEAELIMDKDYFGAGTKFMYVVYETPDGLFTFKQNLPASTEFIDPFYGTFTTEVIHDSVSYMNSNVSNMINTGTTQILVCLNIASFEAAFAAEGYTEDMTDYLRSASLYVVPNGNIDPRNFIGQKVAGGYSENASEICISHTYSPLVSERDKWYLAQFKFVLGEITHEINIILQAGYSGDAQSITPIYTLDGVEIVDGYCCEEDGDLSFDNMGCDIVLQDGTPITLPIDTSTLSCDKPYVGILKCTNPSTVPNPDAGEIDVDEICECDPCGEISATMDITPTGCVGGLCDLGITINVLSPSNVLDIKIINTLTLEEDNSGSEPANLTLSWSGSSFSYKIEITLDNGCVHEYSGIADVSLIDLSGNFNDVFVAFNAFAEGEEDCNCFASEPNKISIVKSLVPAGYEFTEDLISGIATDETEVLDTAERLTVKRKVSFTDASDSFAVMQTFSKLAAISTVINNRDITHNINASCELELTFVDSFDSGLASDSLIITVETQDSIQVYEYDQLASPYGDDLVIRAGETILIQNFVEFDDSSLGNAYSLDPIEHNVPASVVLTPSESGGLLVVGIAETIPYTPATKTLTIDIDGEVNIYDQLTTPYADDLPISEGSIATITFTSVGAVCDTSVNETVVFDNAEASIDCDYAGYSLAASYDDVAKTFEITFTGDVNTLTDKNYPRFTLGSGTNPLDDNNSGFPLQVSGTTFSGSGLLLAAWKLKKEGCKEVILTASAFGKDEIMIDTGSDVSLNIDLSDIVDAIGDLKLSLDQCCNDCGCSLDIECTGEKDGGGEPVARLSVNINECDVDSILLLDDNSNIIVAEVDETYLLSQGGNYHFVVQTTDGCLDKLTYNLIIPNAGDLEGSPPTITPV